MGKFFAWSGETGKVGNISYRNRLTIGNVTRYVVDVDGIRIGEIWCNHERRGRCSAVSHAEKGVLIGPRMVEGFVNRWAATEYLLNVGFRYGPEDPITVDRVETMMRMEQLVRDRITQRDKEKGEDSGTEPAASPGSHGTE